MTRNVGGLRVRTKMLTGALLAVVATAVLPAAPARPIAAAADPDSGVMFRPTAETTLEPAAVANGFQDQVVFSGLSNPMGVEFASDGRVFVAEKSGRIRVFSSLTDSTPSDVINLSTQVFDFWDRGLLGFALHPNFPATPYAYALYTYNALPGGSAPQWSGDSCPSNPGINGDGCVVTGRLDRIEITGNTGSVDWHMLTDWCQQYPSHSAGTLLFLPDGSLLVSYGEGANFDQADYGQLGGSKSPVVTPANPCGDPPSAAGTALTPPSAEGGALRSQDVVNGSDPVGLGGTILRIDPATAAGVASNPFAGSGDANARRILAHGLRNPFRIARRPGSDEIWIGDVGWDTFEEIDRLIPGGSRNFGWPCYEGVSPTPPYDNLNLTACETLYGSGDAIAPYFQYQQGAAVVPGDTGSCPAGGGSSISGIVFYPGGAYPDQFDDALFFSDYSRGCMWVIPAGSNGLPDVDQRSVFATGVGSVEMQIGPGGDIYWVNLSGGSIHRIRATAANRAPTASFTATPSSGTPPLTVTFNGNASSDPDADALEFDWDLDGNNQYEITDGSPTQQFTYTTAGSRTTRLRVRDPQGLQHVATRTVNVGATSLPVPVIDTPSASFLWSAGQTVSFRGHATDAQDGNLPASALRWSLILHHCETPGNCHAHPLTEFDGVASGTFTAPDHAYPAEIELRLTATDSSGGTKTVSRRIDPATVTLTLRSGPSGARIVFDSLVVTAPRTMTVIKGSSHTISVASPQTIGGVSRPFIAWSDGGAASHTIKVSTSRTITAWFKGGDTTRPTISFLRVGGLTGATAGPRIPSRIRWGGSDAGGTGVAGYALEVSSNGGATWTRMTLSPTSRTSFDLDLSSGGAYRFRVKARDRAGNWGAAWTTSAVIRPSVLQETSTSLRYTSGWWATVSDADAWGGRVRRTTRFGGAMSYVFTGRAVAWVGPTGAGYGKVRVYIDGVLKTTIDLGATTGDRRIVYSIDFGSSGSHTLRIAGLGTVGRPNVDLDAVIVYR